MNFKSILQTFVKIFLPLAFGCLLLWFLYSHMDVTEIWRVIREGVRYDIILVSLLFGLFANVVRGLRWGLLISSLGERFKMSNIIYAVLGNYAVNMVLPRVGEVWRCGIITKYDKIPFTKLLGTLLIDRVSDTIVVGSITLLIFIFNFDFFVSFFAKKALGQHFLKDLQIAQRIADTLSDYKDLPVLEIGPGMGVLTQYLLEAGHDLTVVELDMESVDYLEQNFPALEGRILAEDFLRLDLSKLFPGQFCVIGNYPYNISSQIFFKVLDFKEHVPCCSGMIQKEVAERLAAGPGSKTYGILSVLLQAWYTVEYLFTVSEFVFDPPPKVKSAVIRMVRNDRKELGCDEKLFKTVVKTSFNQRRKTLRNSMKPLLGKDCPDYALPVFDKRPEQLSVEQFVELTLIADRWLKQTGTIQKE